MRLKRSDLWSHFTVIHDTKFAICNICKRKYSFKTSVTNLKTHFDKSHKYQIVDKYSSSTFAMIKSNLEEENQSDHNGIEIGTALMFHNETESTPTEEHFNSPNFSVRYDETDFKKTEPKSTSQKTKNKNEILNTKKPVDNSKLTYDVDEFNVFGDVVAHKLRALKSRRVQCIVEYKINSILYDAEMGKYDEPQQTSL
ncbi:Zinc finger C2H2-type,Zinc finger, BED-type [Cinara cedri]|uniref:Zinc finger C2H2-type,Zinc finger, BED-type n=1 Tax=Cinara cedri TaxID=506608 RepID=A0A5E4MYL6_9HEMI|nr:Zinc finger C2H2-type,Zinc finger, BED-type [Cinara cedri]